VIARKVHDYLRFAFPFNSVLLSIPLRLRGFGFPSVARLNDCAAVTGLLRDLNHYFPLFSDMERITLAIDFLSRRTGGFAYMKAPTGALVEAACAEEKR